MSTRSEIRIADLKARTPAAGRMMHVHVKVPMTLFDAIADLAGKLDASKAEVIIALLNTGLEAAATRVKGLKATKGSARHQAK